MKRWPARASSQCGPGQSSRGRPIRSQNGANLDRRNSPRAAHALLPAHVKMRLCSIAAIRRDADRATWPGMYGLEDHGGGRIHRAGRQHAVEGRFVAGTTCSKVSLPGLLAYDGVGKSALHPAENRTGVKAKRRGLRLVR